ncbi:MAG TPA: hypothetical protein VMU53_02755, partial [Candidatus Sulfotelmatobacter sp.]|nr:hypothetical protein [Candidatus Sulfotelmatobacter sp.]
MKCLKVASSWTFAVLLLLLAGLGSPAFGQTSSSSNLTKRLVGDYGYWSQTQTPPYSSAQIP